MAISRQTKVKQLEALQAKFAKAKGVAFVHFIGPGVEEVRQIRRDLAAQGMSYTVIKKTLIALAAKNEKLAEFASTDLEGPVAVIVSEIDEIMPAAAIKKIKEKSFDKATETVKFDFAGSVFEGKFVDAAATAILGNTPSREESLGKIVGMLRSGPQKIHASLTHGLRGIHASLKDAEKYAQSA
jgi:large subunit ribosomal protein L10